MVRSGMAGSRRRVLAGLVTGAGGALLAACGAQQQAQTSAPKGLAAASIAFETFRGGTNNVWGEEMAKTFMDKNPNVKVEFRPIVLEGGNQQSAYPKMLAQ